MSKKSFADHLKCVVCGKTYDIDEVPYVCPEHGVEGILDVQYDYQKINYAFSKDDLQTNKDFSIWRYKPLLPIDPSARVPLLSVGWTPLYNAEQMATQLGLKQLWIKDDGRQPTASFKDRASAIAILKAQEQNAEIITTASTGNAAAALSGLCASIQQDNVIFVPKSAPTAKIAQLLTYGSQVILVDGTYDDAFDLCMAAVNEYGWYNRNTGYNPYMTEGKKTAAFEICEQLNWEIPDRIFVSVGDGCIIGGIHKGLKDLKALGWIDRIPKLMGIQAEGSSYLYQAWKNKEDVLTKPPVTATTIADSISAGLPRDRIKALAAVTDTEGMYMTVTDEEILTAVIELARGCGVFAEPAGATAYAGLKKAVNENMISTDEKIVVLNTGNGLKDVQSAMIAVKNAGSAALTTAPDLKSFKAQFSQKQR
jgi:threonine synthase